MLSIISLLDDRARPKGTRDPLGAEAVWSFMGRKVVGNLTTVTNNLDHFIVALLCCHHANAKSKVLEEIHDHFMRAEQLAAYLKLHAEDSNFLGVRQAKKNFKASSIAIGNSTDVQILSDQLGYGLWGLYSSALEGAGLIRGMDRRPTEEGQVLIDLILAHLGAVAWTAFQSLASGAAVTHAALASLSAPFQAMLHAAALKRRVVTALIAQQRDCVLQSQLYFAANSYLAEHGARTEAQVFCTWLLERHGLREELKTAFKRLRDIEVVLVLAGTLMTWLQGQSNASLAQLHATLAERSPGVTCHMLWQDEPGLPYRAFLMKLAGAINAANAPAVIAALLEQNLSVMRQRGGAAWVEIDPHQRMLVRVPNNRTTLPSDLAAHSLKWQNSYFVASFLSIIKQGQTWKT